MEKKRVLMVITKGGIGGAQKYVRDLSLHLTAQYDVSLAAGNEGLLTSSLSRYNIPVHIIPQISNSFRVGTNLKAVKAIVDLIAKDKADIVHAHSSLAGFATAIAVWILRIRRFEMSPKLIFTVHGWAFNEDRPPHQKVLLWILQMLTVVMSDRVIAVSEAIMEKIPSLLRKRARVIYNGIEAFTPETKVKARSHLIPNTKDGKEIWVGYIGELNLNKGVDILLKAVRDTVQQPPFKLVIIGDGIEKQHLVETSERLHIDSFTTFVGAIPNASHFIKAFDLLVMPSRTEAMPYVPLEAGITKTPIIASAVGGIREIIENFTDGLLVRPGRPKELTIALHSALQNPLRMKSYADSLYKKVTTTFKSKECIRKTIELYNSLLR